MRILLYALLMGGFAMTASADSPIRVLLVTGSHPFDPRLYATFEGHDDIVWDKQTQSPDPCHVFKPGFAEGYDVVVLYDFEQEITDAQKKAFLDAFGKGRGLFVWHHALCSHAEWPAYRELTGGQFFFGPTDRKPASTYKGSVSVTYEPVSDNPVTKGLKPFTAVEEPYKTVWRSEDSVPLLTTSNPDSDHVVSWSRTQGQSRIICTVCGHGGDIFVTPEFHDFMGHSLRWLAKRDPAAPVKKEK